MIKKNQTKLTQKKQLRKKTTHPALFTQTKNMKGGTSQSKFNMKGGAKAIGGFIKMMKYLDDVNEILDKTYEYASPINSTNHPYIIEYIDNLGFNKDILARWVFTPDKLSIASTQPVEIIGNTQVFTNFDEFCDMVVLSLENIEYQIYNSTFNITSGLTPEQTEFTNLSMLAKDETNLYPYYLLEKSNEADYTILS
jgi:hypothetical protein